MSQQTLALVEKGNLKGDVPDFHIGDTVDVHTRILEGEKERIQIFNGVVIARAGSGTRETFVVRDDDPLSARAEVVHETVSRRGAHEARVTMRATLRSDRESFVFTAELCAQDAAGIVARREWNEVVPRQGV